MSDKVAMLSFAGTIAIRFNMTVEQVGIRFGMLAASAFPLIGAIMIFAMRRYFLKKEK